MIDIMLVEGSDVMLLRTALALMVIAAEELIARDDFEEVGGGGLRVFACMGSSICRFSSRLATITTNTCPVYLHIYVA